jgi:purine-nucleoside phosphorylase
MLHKIKQAVDFIKSKTDFEPEYGVILGTGLGALADEIDLVVEIDYKDIPHFPLSTIEFHSGKLIFGYLEGKPVVTMKGRFHFYEGYNMKEVTFPVRVLKLLGIKKLFVSNAAGSLNPNYDLSDLMIINDHINLQMENPLVGESLDELGDRFPDMSEPYDLELVSRGLKIAKNNKIPTHQGVYVSVTGPNLETVAEYKYLRIIGGDAVGMSTVPEVLVARHMDIPVFAISVITDYGVPGKIEKINIEKIIAAAMKAEPGMTKIIKELIATDVV